MLGHDAPVTSVVSGHSLIARNHSTLDRQLGRCKPIPLPVPAFSLVEMGNWLANHGLGSLFDNPGMIDQIIVRGIRKPDPLESTERQLGEYLNDVPLDFKTAVPMS